jgi:hypothetical protein
MVEIFSLNRGVRVCCRNETRTSFRRKGFFSSFGLFCLLLGSAVLIVAGDVSRDESNEDLGAEDSKPQVGIDRIEVFLFDERKYSDACYGRNSN